MNLWHDFASLWGWALQAGGLPLVIAAVITAGLLALVAGPLYYAGVGIAAIFERRRASLPSRGRHARSRGRTQP